MLSLREEHHVVLAEEKKGEPRRSIELIRHGRAERRDTDAKIRLSALADRSRCPLAQDKHHECMTVRLSAASSSGHP